jgi:DNA mismatch repair protein MutS
MSLAWAILKENHEINKSKTLFATHYHELIDESKKLK